MKLSFYLILIMFTPYGLSAQIKEVLKKTNPAGEIQSYSYSFTSAIDDTVSIKIVDPQGVLLDVPFRRKEIATNESLTFHLNSSYWKQGKYQIIVESEKKGVITKGINLHPKGMRKK